MNVFLSLKWSAFYFCVSCPEERRLFFKGFVEQEGRQEIKIHVVDHLSENCGEHIGVSIYLRLIFYMHDAIK